MKLLLDNLPHSLDQQREVLGRCLSAFAGQQRIHQIILFGSYARGDGATGSDIDLCIVADDAEDQLDAARKFRQSIRHIRPKPAFTLLPISPARLAEKKASGDHFFLTILKEGKCLATED